MIFCDILRQIFAKVALFTTVEKYCDDDFINHHGIKRNVQEKETKFLNINLNESKNRLNGIPNVRLAHYLHYLLNC